MQSLNILVAEDEFLCLIGLREYLKQLNHNIVGEAADGNTLVELAMELHPDLIITDINLDSQDGIESIRKIHQSTQIPCIIVTGYDDKKLIERASEQGVFYFLIKPIDSRDLKAAIEITMSRYEDFISLKNELSDTQKSLEARKHIERAKGILMKRCNLDEEASMRRLQKLSRDQNKKIQDIALEVIKSHELFK